MNRLELINYIVEKKNLRNYLEIGVFTGYVLENCIAYNKLGVDPDCGQYNGQVPMICKTSDDFFESISDDTKFDVIFIDELHVAEQVYRDIVNSMKHLSENGYIVLHDCMPENKHDTRPFEECHNGVKWNGNVYAGYLSAIMTYNIPHYTVNTDEGCGILIPRNIDYKRDIIEYDKGWEYFEENKKELLNLISIEEFKNVFA